MLDLDLRLGTSHFSSETQSMSNSSKKISKSKEKKKSKPKDPKKHSQKAKAHNNTRRRLWQEHEDAKLIELVAKHGHSWSIIAAQLEGRTGKQVRDRYLNKLRPEIKSTPWTPEEDRKLEELYRQYGTKWTLISGYLDGRSESQVKNRFHTLLRNNLIQPNSGDNFTISSRSPSSTRKSPMIKLAKPEAASAQNQEFQPHLSPEHMIPENQNSHPIGSPGALKLQPVEISPTIQKLFTYPAVNILDPGDLISYDNHEPNTSMKTGATMFEDISTPDSQFLNYISSRSFTDKEAEEACNVLPVQFDAIHISCEGEKPDPAEIYKLLNQRKKNLELLLKMTEMDLQKLQSGYHPGQDNSANKLS